jgi:hypothetical protein
LASWALRELGRAELGRASMSGEGLDSVTLSAHTERRGRRLADECE